MAGSNTRIVDMSGAFRVQNPASYAHYYGTPHPRPELLERFVYGLPELNRERLRGARFVASAGCFATTIELMLLPFAKAGLLRGSVEVVGITARAVPARRPRRPPIIRSAPTICARTSRSITPTRRDHGDAERGRRARVVTTLRARVRRRSPAASSRPPSCAFRANVSEDELYALPGRTYRKRTLRDRARSAPAGGRGRARFEPRRSRYRARPGGRRDAWRDGVRRTRQLGQRRRRVKRYRI